jgi:hypothetical protein
MNNIIIMKMLSKNVLNTLPAFASRFGVESLAVTNFIIISPSDSFSFLPQSK